MKKTKNKFAKATVIPALVALTSVLPQKSNAFGIDIDLHANTERGIGASVDADVGLARANVGSNVGLSGVDANVGADVVGVGANTAAHVGLDGVKANANTYAWNVADVGVNAGATWQDGVYVGGTAKFFEPANTKQVALQNGQVLYVPNQPAPKGCAWVYGSNGHVVGYKPVPTKQQVRYVQQPEYTQQAPVEYVQPVRTEYAQPTSVVVVEQQQPVRVVRRVVRVVPAEATEVSFSHERAEQTFNGSTYQKKDFYQFDDPASGYRFTDKRQLTRRVIRRTGYAR